MSVPVTAILLAGCGAQPASQIEDSLSQQIPAAVDEAKNKVETISADIKSLLEVNKDLQCTSTFTDEKFKVDGTTYISKGKIRTDSQSQMNGQPFTSHMIIDGSWMYLWNDQANIGTKMNVDIIKNDEQFQKSAQTMAENISDLNKQVDYKCSSWTSDSSKFTVPQNIQFTDSTKILEQVKDLQGASGQTPPSPTSEKASPDAQSMCQICEKLPEAAKAQCLKGCQSAQ